MVWNIAFTLVASPQIKPTKYSEKPENMFGIVFEKANGRGRKANRTSVYAEAAVGRVL